MNNEPHYGPWLTRTEAAALVRVSLRVFDRLRSKGLVRDYHVRGTRSVRFKKEEVEGLLS